MKDEIKEILEYVLSLTYGNENAIKGINKVKDYITNLQEENQRLKELADKYEEEHKTTFIEWTNTLDRNRKAIEYIKHLDNVFIDDKKQDEILNILEGSDKEWQ